MSKVAKEKAKVILFCGLSNAGKTTILNIFTKGDVFKTAPTLGVSFSTLSIKNMTFRIFDLGGQEKLRDEVTALLPFADIIIYVVDGSNIKELPKACEEFKRILALTDKKLTPICVLKHKTDLSTIKASTIISRFGLKKILNRHWNILNTSAVTLDGLLDLYSWIVNETTGESPQFLIEKKVDDEFTFRYPCPMMKELEDGTSFCLNQDAFIEIERITFGFHDEVSKMVLKALPTLRDESLKSSGKDICPDFCLIKQKEKVLRCPVTNAKLKTRGITVSLKRYEDAIVLSQIYGLKIGTEICRECFYKLIISPNTLLSMEEIIHLQKSFN